MRLLENVIANPVGKSALIFSALAAIVLTLAVLLLPVLVPLVIAFTLHSILEPAASFLERKGLGRGNAIALVLILMVALIAMAIYIFVPQINQQLALLQKTLPQTWKGLSHSLQMFTVWLQQKTGMQTDLQAMVMPMVSGLQATAKQSLVTVTGFFAQVAVTLILVPLITYFLLRDYRPIRNQMMGWLPNRYFELGWLIYAKVAKQLELYVRGVMLQSTIMALVTATGFALLGLELATLLGILAGLLNLIPYVGPLLAMIPPLLVTLSAGTPDPVLMISVIAVVAAAQVIDNVLVVPFLIADVVNLHPLTVLLGVIIIGNLFGFIGMIVAIPLLATAKITLLGLVSGFRKAV